MRADEIELVLLRLGQVLRVLPVRRTCRPCALIEHARVEIVADVVVRLDRSARARLALHVEDDGLDGLRLQAPVALDLLLEVGAHDLVDEDVERVGLPPAVHVRLAQTERGVAQEALVEALIVNRDVTGRGATDRDAGQCEQIADDGLGVRRTRRNAHGGHEPPEQLAHRMSWRRGWTVGGVLLHRADFPRRRAGSKTFKQGRLDT